MAYTVTAPLVIAHLPEGGGDLYLYQGAAVPEGQSSDWLKSHKDSGMIAETPDAPPAEGDDRPRARK